MDDMFFAFAKHEQEKMDIVDAICGGRLRDSFTTDDDLTQDDLDDIKREVFKRSGIYIDFS